MNTKEFEKQTLEQLLIDLKDIDNYKSFRKGAFVYDLGHYQGQLLLQEIERLNNKIDELHEDLKTLWIVLWNMDTEMTGYQNEIYDKYYDEFHKE